ncbi:MAG: hypothetical protein LAO22_02630 [Acidobacteriia bacterium]|nr:hypothetical protein [Terriglobia bacterium]
MRFNNLKATLKTAVLVTTVLLLGAGLAVGQVTVNLTAGPSTATLPDGSAVPMWGYSCDGGASANCRALNGSTSVGAWSPVVITVPTGQNLTISLTNSLSFTAGAGTNGIPTSLTIVGQLGGGLGSTAQRSTTPSPDHPTQTLTWPAASSDPGDGANNPPPQGPRVQSFATEVAAGATTSLTWTAPRPGTYLLESGTHPSIQGPMGLFGIVVVTSAPVGTTAGTAYSAGANPAVTYNADIPLLFSEIDPVQNKSVDTAVRTAGFTETKVWSGQPDHCGNAASADYNTCYPPAVNYSPRYYLINGLAFDKTHASLSLFPVAPASGVTGTVLVRMVNAGLRMHIPSIVGAQTGSAASGFGLIAEDGNPLPGVTRVQSEVFMAPGKTYDVMINVPAAGGTALPIFDRQGSLSGNATTRDAGMLAYLSVNGAALPNVAAFSASATANGDTYHVIADHTLTVADPSKGVIGNDANVYNVKVSTPPTQGTLTLNTDGTFTYVPNAGWTAPDSFVYQANGSGPTATVTLDACTNGNGCLEAAVGISLTDDAYTSAIGPRAAKPASFSIKPPGVLFNDKDGAGFPLKVALSGSDAPVASAGLTLSVDPDGGFNASVSAAGTYTFTYKAVNSQGTVSASAATVTLSFPTPNGPAVTLVDGATKAALSTQDYRWIIEEDRTFYVNPNCQTNPVPAGCPVATPQGAPAIFGTNFHTSYMPVVAQGCVGTISCEDGQFVLDSSGAHVPAVCDIGNGACRPGTTKTEVDPSQVVLDPTKHYYISVLPGDAMDPGHGMGGAQIAPGQTSVSVTVEPELAQAAKVSVFVFEDDHPLNGEHDASGGIDTLSPNEAGLGGFNITILDLVGMSGDPAGQMTYDEFGQPLSNALAGTIDPVTKKDACPVTANPTKGFDGTDSPVGITGVIPVCPRYESDGTTLSPLAGQAIVVNMPPGRYGIVATPAADRIARGEEWLQTNTLDGGKDHEAFIRNNEPSYFQEFGPGSFHVSIGFANPKFIHDIGHALCTGTGAPACNQTVQGIVTGAHMSRPSDERLYGSGTNDTFGYTQCYVSLGSPDGADFAFTKCNSDGTFSLAGIPEGDWKITVFDQWNDIIVDGISTPVRVGSDNATLCHGSNSSGSVCDMGEIAVNAWKDNLNTRTFFDVNGNGISDDGEQGLTFVPTNIRYRDGSISNLNSTDLEGFAGFNEVFPIFNWYVMETDSNRYKTTGIHVINDAGGPVDGSTGPYACGQGNFPACGDSSLLQNLARTNEDFPLPVGDATHPNLRIPGAVYCDHADCAGFSIANGPIAGGSSGPGGSTGRIDPPWVTSYGWQNFMGQNQLLEFGKKPFAAGENGGIRGHVVYTSTRPFDDPALLLQLTWEPQVPNVTMNLYQEGFAADGVTPTLTLVDTTKTSSWDEWAQGFRSDGVPNMNCPGQSTGDLFFYTINNQPNLLDFYNSQHGGPAVTPLPYNSQYKCYDGMHNWNQLQPAPYDGMYSFPSVTGLNPTTGKPAGTNCTICVSNPDNTDPYRFGTAMLPAGKYVVEMIVPPGYELVKEEDKNILLGDTYEAPVTTQFAGFGNIFIMPDQASVASAYNPNNPLNSTTDLGATPRHEGDTGSVETFWPCVGTARVVPDYMSLFPQSGQNSPFAGATRNLCDRKEVTLEDQMSVLAKFYVFSSTHVAAHFTGIISDDFTSEFDPFSPAFGEKFSPPNLPVGVRDFNGNEIARVWSDQHGIYNGLTYSTFSVNPPDPSGYIPQMMVMCMNDRGSGVAPDPFYQAAYSQFCYEWSFMPGQTSYMDTPVIPTSAFAAEYNHPDCAYPNATPAIKSVIGNDATGSTAASGKGPWVSGSGAGHTLTITALGDVDVNDYAYSGPSATVAPFNNKTITRHYGFGTTAGTVALLGSDGNTYPLTGVSWSDLTITGTVPNGVPACAIQQQRQYGGPNNGNAERCGELVITAANGKKSIDTVTVTIGSIGTNGSKIPTVLAAGQTIQSAIDAAAPGDLIIVPPGSYHELLLMWKPVRLQGVGAASSIIDANTHPSGTLLNDWRLRVVCLFGLAPNGVPDGYDSACGNGWNFFSPTTSNPQVDRLPLEATVGWDATLNGNLAEQLQEPSLMGAYEGAGITVLSKGVRFPNGSNPWTDGAEPGGFPVGTTLLDNGTQALSADPNGCGPNTTGAHNPFPSSFQCNPSRIDGLSVTNSSQGGGGIFVHGWGHNLEIANNRVYNNQGTLSGGITVGQGEHPGAYVQGAANADPGSCVNGGTGVFTNTQLPYCFDRFVNVHHNAVTANSSEGDELFSATPSGAGGVSFCSGADNYQFNFNWVCGNMSTGDGAGVAQMGFVWDASIQHNTILFNQATNPTTPSNGGGLLIMSAPDTDPTCPGEPDADCSHAFGTVGDGIGRNLVINANLIMGNAAEAGAGGGIRFQGVNGVEVSTFPNNPERWYSVSVTNNIIANNVAGWDGGGLSLQDSIGVNLINNTIVSNDSTASSGTLFGAFFATQASSPTPCPRDAQGANIPCVPLSDPQPAGLSSAGHTAEFLASLPASITCPPGHPIAANPANGVVNGACRTVSYPSLYNDVFWQNRAFNIVVTQPAAGATQATVTLVPTLSQTNTGDCIAPPAGTTYWDIGLRGDHGPTDHSSGVTFTPEASVLTDITGYAGGGSGFRANTASFSPGVVRQYCNGSKIPPEAGASTWYQVPPGTFEGNVPVPVFSLTAGATVDEGNNWINISWGPLSLIKPTTETNPATEDVLADYSLLAGSPAINYITPVNSSRTYAAAPNNDFFGNLRKTNNAVDAGAVEFAGPAAAQPTLTSIAPSSGRRNSAVNVTLTGTNLTGATGVAVSGTGVNAISVSNLVVVNDTTVTATFTIGANAAVTGANASHNVTVSTPGGTSNAVIFTVVAPSLASVTPNTGVRSSTVNVSLVGTGFTGATAVNVVGPGAVNATSFTVVDDSHINATIQIGGLSNAQLGNQTVSVTTPGGTTNTVPFTVLGGTVAFTGPVPVLTSTPANTNQKNGVITVTNSATGAFAGPITLTANPTIVPVTGGANGTFSIQPGGTCVSGFQITSGGGTCTINVRYQPNNSSNATAHVTLNDTGATTATQSSANFTAN